MYKPLLQGHINIISPNTMRSNGSWAKYLLVSKGLICPSRYDCFNQCSTDGDFFNLYQFLYTSLISYGMFC